MAAAVCALLASAVPANAAAARMTFSAAARSGDSVTFPLRGIGTNRIRRAYVKAGRYRVQVAAKSVRRAQKQKKKLKVKLPKRIGGRKVKHPVLVVVTWPVRTPAPPVTEPEPDPEPSPEPDTGTDEPTTPGVTVPEVEVPVIELPVPEVPVLSKSTTRSHTSPILSDSEAASRVRRSSWEPRPGNATANSRTPRDGELDKFMSDNIAVHSAYKPLVTGNFTGTTDEIIQWAAWKWGIDEDVLRAVAAVESWWKSSAVGDSGKSFGMTQIKITFHAGTYPLSADSTAFNMDYYGALFRSYYGGHVRWLNDVEKGETYRAGDMWGSIGAHYAGRWHTAAAEGYITKVKKFLSDRVWESRDF